MSKKWLRRSLWLASLSALTLPASIGSGQVVFRVAESGDEVEEKILVVQGSNTEEGDEENNRFRVIRRVGEGGAPLIVSRNGEVIVSGEQGEEPQLQRILFEVKPDGELSGGRMRLIGGAGEQGGVLFLEHNADLEKALGDRSEDEESSPGDRRRIRMREIERAESSESAVPTGIALWVADDEQEMELEQPERQIIVVQSDDGEHSTVEVEQLLAKIKGELPTELQGILAVEAEESDDQPKIAIMIAADGEALELDNIHKQALQWYGDDLANLQARVRIATDEQGGDDEIQRVEERIRIRRVDGDGSPIELDEIQGLDALPEEIRDMIQQHMHQGADGKAFQIRMGEGGGNRPATFDWVPDQGSDHDGPQRFRFEVQGEPQIVERVLGTKLESDVQGSLMELRRGIPGAMAFRVLRDGEEQEIEFDVQADDEADEEAEDDGEEELTERLSELEDRLEKIERMLERLLDRQ